MSAQSPMSRRQFIRITALAGALTLGGGIAAATLQRRPQVQRIRETRLLMGSIANITILTDDPGGTTAAVQATFDRMAGLESIFSRFRPDSQLSLLNAVGRLKPASPELQDVLRRAIALGELTRGAFDVTVEPVLRLYRAGSRSGTLPTDDAISQARMLVNYRWIGLSADEVWFEQPGMALTLDGIAKGYIIDQGVHALREHGVAQVLVEFGGDLCADGRRGAPWQIGIQPPRSGMRMPVASVDRAAMATSGDYLNAFTPDRRLNHILDPDSGLSPTELASATVIAPAACDADALATALMVMGNRGLKVLEQVPDVEALTIDKRGIFQQTAGFPLLA